MARASSGRRYAEYRERLRQRPPEPAAGRGHHGGHRPAPRSDDEKPTRRSRSFGQLLVQFFGLLRGHEWAIFFAIATLTVSTLLHLVSPLATKLVIDNVLTDKPLPAWWSEWLGLPTNRYQVLWLIGLFVAGVSLVATAVHLVGRWQATKAVNHLQVAIRRRVFAHAVRLPLFRVYQLKSGGATSLLRDDAGGISDLVFSMLYNPWRAAIQLVGSLIVLTTVDWRMTLGGLLLIPAVYASHRTWINRIRPLYRDIRAQRQEIDGQTTEAFGGMRVVRTYNRERSEAARYVSSSHLLVRQQLFAWWWTRAIELIWEVIVPLASVALLLYGGKRVLDGQMTIGEVTMFLIYLVMLLGPLETLANSAASLQNNLAGLDRVLDLLAEPQETAHNEPTERLDPARVAGRLSLENVSFRYPSSEAWVLRDIDLEIQPGTTVALVGRSGAGKTTLTNLVARFYDPTEGTIRLDGIDFADLPVEAYRRLLGIVEQDVFLFDGTIAENIGYARRDARQEDIEAAAIAANAHEFITQLEKGYDTLIGERGVRLSGGQRQRLAIARALLADPKILILDEATSNLDSESERLIHQSLERLMEGRTAIVIAHRLSTIVRADQIVVLEQGRIVESGTHAQLLEQSGRYRQMVELQMGPDAPVVD
ncbi:MAG: ABC transporter ATP-binding protein/permease [Pirellulaceae bacterium]|nr:ABC transporter ATP-binding protein/permease [Pirellulaceae bacterium]